jgi:hypothetical protein
MKRKPIRVDWDDLESAFDNPNEELVYYLDLVSGHVHLEGEGEESDFDDEAGRYDVGAHGSAAPRSDNTRAYVDRLTTEMKIGWIRRFVDEVQDLDPEWVARLRQALAAEDPAQAIIACMTRNPEGKDRWYRYRADRLHDLIETWLDDHEVSLVDRPPWS